MSDAAGKSFEEPDVRAGAGQVDVAQPFTAHLCLSYFYSALVADHSAVLHAFIFSAEAFPISDRTKDSRTEQPIALRLERAVVDRFWLGHLTMRPLPDLLRG